MVKLTTGEKIARDLCEMDVPSGDVIEVNPADVARRIDEAVLERTKQLAAAQADSKRLRDAIQQEINYHFLQAGPRDLPNIKAALAHPSDTSALDAFVAERMKSVFEWPSVKARIDELEADHAAAVLSNVQLRDAARNVCAANNYTEASQAIRILNTMLLATPLSTEALDKYVAEKVKEASNQLFGKSEQLIRQRDLAVEALKKCGQAKSNAECGLIIDDALSTIKESEGK